MITISHTHADGTILTGSRKGDGVYEIVATHGFRYSRQVGIYLRGSRDRDAQRWRIDAAAQSLRDKGFQVEVDIDDEWRPAAADRVLAAIPAGQPMMPDHHSYPADRRRRERAWDNLDQAQAEDQRATALAARAAAARDLETAKDNPRAIMRRIDRLQADLRRQQRELTAAIEAKTSSSYQARLQREIDRLTDDISHQQAKLAARAESDEFVAWRPDTVAIGDVVRVGGHGWYRVTRVNRKTVSLDSPVWPQKAPFDEIFGRRRDGLQYDTPTAEPWPVGLAQAVARWQRLRRAAGNPGYDEGSGARPATSAMRSASSTGWTCPSAMRRSPRSGRPSVTRRRCPTGGVCARPTWPSSTD